MGGEYGTVRIVFLVLSELLSWSDGSCCLGWGDEPGDIVFGGAGLQELGSAKVDAFEGD